MTASYTSRRTVTPSRINLWAALAERLREGFASAAGMGGPWHPAGREQYEDRVREAVSEEQWWDECAQTCACLIGVLRIDPRLLQDRVAGWMLRQADPVWRDLLGCCLALARSTPTAPPGVGASVWQTMRTILADVVREEMPCEPAAEGADALQITHFYEQFLAAYDGRGRARFGVYYTPPELVSFAVTETDRLLRDEFARSSGLADLAAPPVPRATDQRSTRDASHGVLASSRVLDPAAGSGAFLTEILGRAATRCVAAGMHPTAQQREQALLHALARLQGWERLLPAAAVAQLNLAARLLDLGFSFASPAPLTVQLCNALAPPTESTDGVGLVIGNPPFSGVSRSRSEWIDELLRGRAADDPWRRSYFHIDGQPLGERKVWLNDDYVKFFRLGQWLLDRTGQGMMVLVSNHGYLDNITFRAMRRSLLDSFTRITVVDLHGNRKRHETTPQGAVDANVFHIEQGNSITFMRKCAHVHAAPASQVACLDVWGSVDEKLAWLARRAIQDGHDSQPEPLEELGRVFQPGGPLFVFRPARNPREASHARRTMLLNEVMPVHSTAPVTARDHFVVALSRDELLQRMDEFANLDISDDEIRARYFQRTRSPRYAAGDTRGWSLSSARQRAAALTDRAAPIRNCLYRPFDVRPVYWAPWMIDWPRPALDRQLAVPANWCLIARRQMLPGKPCNFFWASRRMALDGVIRSDNRGSELLLPVFVRDEPGGSARGNFAERFIDACVQGTGLSYEPAEYAAREDVLGPTRLAAYLYGLFHLPQYRDHYAQALWSGFPPVLIPAAADVLQAIAGFGMRLLKLHGVLGEFSDDNGADRNGEDQSLDYHPQAIVRPRYENGRVWIARETPLMEMTDAQWQFRVGAHQVCRKWLSDRQGRTLSTREFQAYRRLTLAVQGTLETVQELEAYCATDGWWKLFL